MAQRPVLLSDVKMPTRAEYARHMLTHLPYRRWCIWCQMARRPNSPHRALPLFSRDIPLLVFDYVFENATDEDMVTVLVARIYPYRAIFAIQCDVKGEDPYAVTRLAVFLRNCGVVRCAYM